MKVIYLGISGTTVLHRCSQINIK